MQLYTTNWQAFNQRVKKIQSLLKNSILYSGQSGPTLIASFILQGECFEIFPIKRVSREFIKLQNSFFSNLSFAFMKLADMREFIIHIMDPINLIELSERHFNHIEQYKRFIAFFLLKFLLPKSKTLFIIQVFHEFIINIPIINIKIPKRETHNPVYNF